ncbi:16S rRNA (guanine(527)-N(7))-methyltransferase RsmG [Serinicoccus chungangensis]|uniref:Ribosomal RNA small subunit methyltransferase G n=1 Tax=Serinicoccus chungangensis TaxID=767452 RepID=A0A0W8I3I0_9MICO|nr:16S rRNA (guanine(527)-N(7))-methyltransferase RsmG [Serinicoccus chungangensis]KUG52475.1 16S rRNA (guanine(527)-N(7))-methyltransferase RsmG [Serinicoccus chungangensis]
MPATGGAPPPSDQAREIFADRLPVAVRYAELLATTGISHGLIGPREADRLWDRHLVNCAVVEVLCEDDAQVVDIGSGAGLPGVVLAIARPDLRVHLVEPLLRRTTWLEQAVVALGLDNVTVHRGRAQAVDLRAPVVTARAVASLDKLVTWALPLLAEGGRLLALKGQAAATELEQARPVLRRHGVRDAQVHVLAERTPAGPVRVVEIVRPEPGRARRAVSRSSRG